jgi:RNA polymerase sigma-70 factor
LNEVNTRRPTALEADLLRNLGLCADLLAESHARCARAYPGFEVPFEEFRDAVRAAALKHLIEYPGRDAKPSLEDLKRFIAELKLDDLYLGLGCLRGDERAWWEFDRQHRSFIERLTRHLVNSNIDADEVIDAVSVELFGTKIIDGVRQSKLRTYTGRGTLQGWLRVIITHAAADLHRKAKVEAPAEDLAAASDKLIAQGIWTAEESMLTNMMRNRYRSATVAALDGALAALDDYETLLLLYYHVEGLKLREIARIVEEPGSPIRRWFARRNSPQSRVHESTVMRWLDKVYKKILDRFKSELAGKHGLKPEEIEICRAIAAEDPAQSINISTSSKSATEGS